MRCNNCGHENPLTNSFCTKCASHLSANLKLMRSRQVFIPPQADIADQIRLKPTTPSTSRSWLAVSLMVGLILILSIVYGLIFP